MVTWSKDFDAILPESIIIINLQEAWEAIMGYKRYGKYFYSGIDTEIPEETVAKFKNWAYINQPT